MIYEFTATDGETIEIYATMDEAPPIGKKIRRAGKVYTRLPGGQVMRTNPSKAHTSRALPTWWPYAPRHDQRGRPVFLNDAEIRESQAKANDQGELQIYD